MVTHVPLICRIRCWRSQYNASIDSIMPASVSKYQRRHYNSTVSSLTMRTHDVLSTWRPQHPCHYHPRSANRQPTSRIQLGTGSTTYQLPRYQWDGPQHDTLHVRLQIRRRGRQRRHCFPHHLFHQHYEQEEWDPRLLQSQQSQGCIPLSHPTFHAANIDRITRLLHFPAGSLRRSHRHSLSNHDPFRHDLHLQLVPFCTTCYRHQLFPAERVRDRSKCHAGRSHCAHR